MINMSIKNPSSVLHIYPTCLVDATYVSTAIPRDTLPLDMLTPQIRHYELRQKNSRYANFSDFLPPAMLFLIFFQKNSRYANFSDLSTPSYAIFD